MQGSTSSPRTLAESEPRALDGHADHGANWAGAGEGASCGSDSWDTKSDPGRSLLLFLARADSHNPTLFLGAWLPLLDPF